MSGARLAKQNTGKSDRFGSLDGAVGCEGAVDLVHGDALGVLKSLLEADHRRIEVLLEAIATEGSLAGRACYASQLVRTCSEIQDVRERTLYKAVDLSNPSAKDMRNSRCAKIRSLVTVIDSHTHRVLPANVHMHDGEGFEETLGQLTSAMNSHLRQEELEIFPRIEALSQNAVVQLVCDMKKAKRNALHRPHRRVGSISRHFFRVVDRLHDIDDAADYFHRDLKHSLSK